MRGWAPSWTGMYGMARRTYTWLIISDATFEMGVRKFVEGRSYPGYLLTYHVPPRQGFRSNIWRSTSLKDVVTLCANCMPETLRERQRIVRIQHDKHWPLLHVPCPDYDHFQWFMNKRGWHNICHVQGTNLRETKAESRKKMISSLLVRTRGPHRTCFKHSYYAYLLECEAQMHVKFDIRT